MTDEEVVKIVQNGQTEMYAEIVKRYERPLFSYIRRLTNQNQEETEDLVEEALINGYINIQGFDTGKKFSSWIYRIAHNQCVDYFRKRKLKREDLGDKEEILRTNEKLIEELEIETEARQTTVTAVERLDPKYREIILLFYFEEKTYEEISDILHIPTTNVGVLLFRAKEKLRKEIRFMKQDL